MNFGLGNKSDINQHSFLGHKGDILTNMFLGHKTTHGKKRGVNLPMIAKEHIYNTWNNLEQNEPKTFDYSKHNVKNSNSSNNTSSIEKHKKQHSKEEKNKFI